MQPVIYQPLNNTGQIVLFNPIDSESFSEI